MSSYPSSFTSRLTTDNSASGNEKEAAEGLLEMAHRRDYGEPEPESEMDQNALVTETEMGQYPSVHESETDQDKQSLYSNLPSASGCESATPSALVSGNKTDRSTLSRLSKLTLKEKLRIKRICRMRREKTNRLRSSRSSEDAEGSLSENTTAKGAWKAEFLLYYRTEDKRPTKKKTKSGMRWWCWSTKFKMTHAAKNRYRRWFYRELNLYTTKKPCSGDKGVEIDCGESIHIYAYAIRPEDVNVIKKAVENVITLCGDKAAWIFRSHYGNDKPGAISDIFEAGEVPVGLPALASDATVDKDQDNDA